MDQLTRLQVLFEKLQAQVAESSHEREQWIALPITDSGKHRLAIDSDKNAIILLSLAESEEIMRRGNVILKNLVIEPNAICKIRTSSGHVESNRYTVIKCIADDDELRHYFLRVADLLISIVGDRPGYEKAWDSITALIELFRALNRPPSRSIRGLWAELLVMSAARRPEILLEAWHIEPGDTFDFSSGESHLEVKATIEDRREHFFSLEQLTASDRQSVVIVSVLLNTSHKQTSLADLLGRIGKRLKRRPDLLIRLEQGVVGSLGSDWRQYDILGFDYEYAVASMEFFLPAQVPKVDPNVPLGVSSIRFRSDLSHSDSCAIEDIRLLDSFFEAL